MNTPKTVRVDGDPYHHLFAPHSGHVLSPYYRTWRTLQSGHGPNGATRPDQSQVIRFNRFLPQHGERMRHQNGHEHRASVCFLATVFMIEMRRYTKLDELLLTRAFSIHDEPEGVIGIDHPATEKKDEHDLEEYLIFERLYKDSGNYVYKEMQYAFLLQFCLKIPQCFPGDAIFVMTMLARNRQTEALFFQGVQMMDYLFYVYEQWIENGISEILDEVSSHQVPKLDCIAAELEGFEEVVWTPERRSEFVRCHS